MNRSPKLTLLILLATVGCGTIPLFAPNARTANRIASANELLTEANTQVATFVANGWLTQAQVNSGVGPILDRAAETVDAAEALHRAGKDLDAKGKLDALVPVLRSVRSQLAAIQRAHK